MSKQNPMMSASGKLGRDPKVQTVGSDNKMMCTVAMAIDCARERDGAPLWIELKSFGRLANILSSHSRGDSVFVCGRIQLHRWRDDKGEQRERLEIIASQIMSARTAMGDAGTTPRDQSPGPARSAYNAAQDAVSGSESADYDW